MLEIIRHVLDAERQAEETLGRAREDAQKIRAAFDAEEQKRLQTAQEQADAHVRERIDQARVEAEKRRAAAREAAEEQLRRFRSDRAAEFDAAADDLLRILTTSMQDRPTAK
jgi:vacuolar-type H+-ATPase subunit H